jgi:hypothetical protein
MANSEDVASVLHRWAYFSCLPRCSWAPVQSLIGAATPYATARSEDLQRLIHESEIMLAPLPDPLKVDLGLHKWIAAAREESYSDWLAWVLQEVAESSLLLDFFGFNDPKLAAELRGCSHRIEREKWIKVDEEVFRLDIFVRFIRDGHRDEASLIVEIKKGSAEAADTQKQQHYLRWHKKESACQEFDRGAFLIVTDAQEMQYCGFEVLRWADVCIRLRRMLPAIDRARGIVKASMVLAFISAVERNLLHLELHQGGSDRFADALVTEHLQRAVQSEEG